MITEAFKRELLFILIDYRFFADDIPIRFATNFIKINTLYKKENVRLSPNYIHNYPK